MRKRSGELFGRFQTGLAVPMSRDTQRDLEGIPPAATKDENEHAIQKNEVAIQRNEAAA